MNVHSYLGMGILGKNQVSVKNQDSYKVKILLET